jgi:acyl carrier protein
MTAIAGGGGRTRGMAETLVSEDGLKRLIIDSLNLEGMSPETIDPDAPLFGAGLGLDSVDALELVVAMEKHYGIKIRSDEIAPGAFASVAALSRFIADRMAEAEAETEVATA